MAKGQKPKRAVQPAPTKQPAAPAAVDANKRKPVWSFRRMDLDGDWPCHRMDQAGLVEILHKLRDFEGRTWAELQAAGKHTTATEIPSEHLPGPTQKRLRQLKLDDVASLWELHINGPCRLWGLRVAELFECLWFDPDHEVYKTRDRRPSSGN